MRPAPPRRRALLAVLAALLPLLAVVAGPVTARPAAAQELVPISGAGSTWSQNALDQWRRNVTQFGLRVGYAGTGSSDGRNQFRNGTVDFAVSEIPYGLTDGGVVDNPPSRPYAYMPVVAGGTSFMYNLKINGQRVTNLRLSGENIARIFTGAITSWDDPALAADNPGLVLPARRIVPVVRSDGSGTTAQFTQWLARRHQGTWDAYCGRANCGQTSNFPVRPGAGFTAQSGSLGVSGFVSQTQNEGTITYVEYSYALNTGYPVAKVLNESGFFVEPTASNVAVALTGATIDTRDPASPTFLTQELGGVYANADPRAYPLSSYSYLVLPTSVTGTFSETKGRALGEFANYFLCEGQQQAEVLGYSPLPINLVQAGLDQVRRIPGAPTDRTDISTCNNPTFSPSGENVLARNAPQPADCDRAGPTQCATGTGGAKATPTAVSPEASGGGAPAGGGGAAAGGDGAAAGGADGTGGTATADGLALGGDAALDPAALGGELLVDPDTGEVLGAAGASSGGTVSAVPLELASVTGSALQRSLVALAVLLLGLLVVLPPLVARRLQSAAAPAAGDQR